MANPRRAAFAGHLSPSTPSPSSDLSSHPSHLSHPLSSFLLFLKRPASFPLLLFLFLLLTWLSFRFQHPPASAATSAAGDGGGNGGGGGEKVTRDADANMVKFNALTFPSPVAADGRGWLLDPVATARNAGLHGGAVVCSLVHVGQIQPRGLRGNHRHHTCNETLVIWGADTKFRLENAKIEKGYAEITIGAGEVAVIASPIATAHALMNIDTRPTYFLGCQDALMNPNSSNTDYRVWKDL